MKFSVGFQLLMWTTHSTSRTVLSRHYIPLPHLHHSSPRIPPSPEEIHTRGVLPAGDKAPPARPEVVSPQLGTWAAGWVTWHTGTHTCTARCLAMHKWINYTAKPSALWSNSSHETNRIQESLKTGHYCNKAKKRYDFFFITFII